MFSPDQYELVDFGRGRKLERFGPWLVDRPAPQAEGVEPSHPELWRQAACRFERTQADRGEWQPAGALPESWQIEHGAARFELAATEFGHLGLFPEQAANWDWIARQVTAPAPLRVLNLFAYTGGSTLVAAAAGAAITHVDAARNTVAWARNAALSGLESAPIRWLVEDAARFVGRELKRGRQYDAVILDPPSYGHGPAGEVWKFDEHLPELLRQCVELTVGRQRFMLLTCHSTGTSAADARELLARATHEIAQKKLTAGDMVLTTSDGRQLVSGVYVRLQCA